jgi:hypothetical protein
MNKGPTDPVQQQDEQGLKQEITDSLAFCSMVQASLPNSASYQASGRKLKAGRPFARFYSLGHPFSQND